MNVNAIGRALISTAICASLIFTGYQAGQTAAPEPVAAVQTQVVKGLVGDQTCTIGPINQAIYGDSITSWQPPYAGDWRRSWVYWASSNAYPAAHGWAQPGATLAQMAANAKNSDAKVVQIMGGTNDLPIMATGKPGTPKAQMLASIDRIVALEQPEEVVILAVPPFGWNYYESNTWNAELKAHAEANGWNFFDPWTGLKNADGWWWPGLSSDAVHLDPQYTYAPGTAIYNHLLSL